MNTFSLLSPKISKFFLFSFFLLIFSPTTILAQDSILETSRTLRYTSPLMEGKDVQDLQQFLNNSGYDSGTVDGKFGRKTSNAVILFQKSNNFWFDGLGAMAIGLLMAIFSFFLLKNVRDFIIGVSVSEEIKAKIKKAALEIGGVQEVLDLKALVIDSNRLLVNLEIHVQEGMITEEIEQLIDKVKAKSKENVPAVFHIQVELETPEQRKITN